MHTRSHILSAIIALSLLASLCAVSRAQDAPSGSPGTGLAYRDTLEVGASDTLRLSGRFLRPGSLRLTTDSGAVLRDSIDYTVDRRSGVVRLKSTFQDTARLHGQRRLVATYIALPLTLPSEFRLRELVPRRDSARGDTMRLAMPSAPITIDNIFGAGLQKSGYIGRGFTVGTNKDLSINSGFRLQLAGKLAEDIDVVAALTDENTPIQPEGNTRTLQELDKVFIKISSPFAAATLGDFSLAYGGTEFGRYTRKVSGVLGEAYGDMGSVSASYASMKGTFRTMQFNGIDGTQGPYRLTGRNGEPRIIVLAGTERVYVDGVEMQRGETNDYVIEYASGELFFRPTRLITSAARITVDFEYADRQYVRSLFTANGTGSLFSKNLNITARYIREGDDKDSPIDADLGDADRAVLAQAGDDQRKAATSGVAYAGIDSARGIGAGQYVRVDSSIGGAPVTFYRYDPGADSATYTVSFSYVGSGNGEYTRRTLGTFVYAGPGAGDYAPVRLLPMPQLQQLANILVDATPVRELKLFGEFAASDLVRNRFSTLDAADNGGSALNAGGSWKPSLGVFGELEVGGRFRATTANFTPIDRINDIEFSRKWDIGAAALATETIREGSLAWRPARGLRLSGGAGSYTRGLFSSQRIEGGLTSDRDTARLWLPALSYSFERIASEDRQTPGTGDWFRQRGEARYDFGSAQPYLRFESENRTATSGINDTLTAASLSFRDIRPGVLFPAFWNMSLGIDLGFRSEDAFLRGALRHQADDVYQQLTWTLRPWHDLSASTAITVRDRTFSEEFRLAGNKDLQTILTKSQIQYAPLKRAIAVDLLYEVSTEKTSRLERLFLKVPFGQGNYVYTGDLNNNGVADESEFEPTRFDGEYVLITVPTDALFPVIDLRTSARLHFRPSRIIGSGSGALGDVLRAVSSESIVRVEEKSSSDKTSDIYLLHFSTFLNDSTTLRGFQTFRQDVNLFEQEQDFSLRLRYEHARGFSQYALANERSFRGERSLRLRTQPVADIGFQADLAFTNDNVASTQASNRARSLTATSFAGDLSYRPFPRVEVGFVLALKSATDSHTGTPLEAAINAQTLRSTVSFDGPGRVRVEVERSEVGLSTAVQSFPYELTDGKPEGQSWVLRMNFDYRITSFLQATLSYVGRTEGTPQLLSTMRAEVRAFF